MMTLEPARSTKAIILFSFPGDSLLALFLFGNDQDALRNELRRNAKPPFLGKR